MIKIILSGPPVPWTPSRVVSGKYAFSPRYKEKQHHQWEVRSQYLDEPMEGPMIIEALFHMSIPTSVSKKKRDKMISQEIMHITKPDIDNCFKYSIDCIKGIVLKDDNQVMCIHARKFYSETPQTVIHISRCE